MFVHNVEETRKEDLQRQGRYADRLKCGAFLPFLIKKGQLECSRQGRVSGDWDLETMENNMYPGRRNGLGDHWVSHGALT